MASSKSWFGVCASGLALLLASCGGDSSDTTVDVKKVDARDLVVPTPDKVTSTETDVDLSVDAKGGYEPNAILGQAMPLFASGNEPFWTAEIENGWIVFERPGLPLVEVPVPEFSDNGSEVSFASEGLNLALSTAACDGDAGPLSIIIKYEAVEHQGETSAIEYRGCAGTASAFNSSGSNSLSWKELIKPSLTAVDACLAKVGQDKLIVALYPREPGTVGMIFGDSLGGYEECGADTQTGEVYFLDPMTAEQATDWMTGAAFVRSGQPLKCKAGEPVEGGIGEYLPAGC